MAEIRPAPGGLEIIRAFVNTRSIDAGTDSLSTPEGLAVWLAEHELVPVRTVAKRPDVRAANRLREAIRALLLANNGEPLDPDAFDTLNRAAEDARFSVRFVPGEAARVEPRAPGVAGALGHIVSTVAHSMADGTWSRFKACVSDECEWAFYDHARNHSRRWCEMALCGNRMKARAYRKRRAGDSPKGSGKRPGRAPRTKPPSR